MSDTNIERKLILIPARLQSMRLPNKPLLVAGGKSLLQWTYELARKTRGTDVFIVTSDVDVMNHCDDCGLPRIRLTMEYSSGTHRCAGALRELENAGCRYDVVMNLQVDEPLVDVTLLDDMLEMQSTLRLDEIATLAATTTADGGGWMHDPDTVKVIVSGGKCRWFSRAAMAGSYVHVGVYVYAPELLKFLGGKRLSHHAELESLEQLTWLEAGFDIHPYQIPRAPLSINSMADFKKFQRKIENVVA